jgi:TRAP-type C4-dicarboxylate transport system permease small subunit
MRGFSRIVAGINWLAEQLLCSIVAVMVIDIGVAIIARYVFNDSIVWTEELARYLFIWLTFLGAGVGIGGKIHVGIDTFVALVPLKNRWRAIVVLDGVSAMIVCGLIWSGLKLTMIGLGSEALLLPIPMAVVYAAAPAGALVMLANCADSIVRAMTQSRAP